MKWWDCSCKKSLQSPMTPRYIICIRSQVCIKMSIYTFITFDTVKCTQIYKMSSTSYTCRQLYESKSLTCQAWKSVCRGLRRFTSKRLENAVYIDDCKSPPWYYLHTVTLNYNSPELLLETSWCHTSKNVKPAVLFCKVWVFGEFITSWDRMPSSNNLLHACKNSNVARW